MTPIFFNWFVSSFFETLLEIKTSKIILCFDLAEISARSKRKVISLVFILKLVCTLKQVHQSENQGNILWTGFRATLNFVIVWIAWNPLTHLTSICQFFFFFSLAPEDKYVRTPETGMVISGNNISLVVRVGDGEKLDFRNK